ncbi:hypothetical protein I9W82_004256 [Candida metapsilosis]|uniref:alpha-galactosidase n=1 Tax=Candida metapsilosis TaxID=273372 RepID=A0A8H7Z9U7_9ASCO|nr:hypothetical protein I9W82_004256 [Candida metapsilosis]
MKSIFTAWLIILTYFTTFCHAKWEAKPKDTWDCILDNPPTTSDIDDSDSNKDTQIYDIDLFDTPKSLISHIHSKNKSVICYFSAGTFETWRPDADNFTQSELGHPLHSWEGERWLNITSPNVVEIMEERIALAKSKGCDAVDPDNIDAYAYAQKKTGFKITKTDSVNYVKHLAKVAHKHDLAIGLKNGGDIVKKVVSNVDFAVVEQCGPNKECKLYQAFIKAKKPVFHIEYPPKSKSKSKSKRKSDGGDVHWPSKVYKKYCTFKNTKGFSTILKQLSLNEWVYHCPTS